MGKKISNEVRMLGILPSQGADPIPVGKIPDGGTQVAVSNASTGTVVDVHQVTAGKTLYLTTVCFSIRNYSGAEANARVEVTDSGNNYKYYMYYLQVPDEHGIVDSINFLPPLEIQATWKIRVYSSSETCGANLFIHGYEV